MLCGRRANELLANSIRKAVRQQLLAHFRAQLGALLRVLVSVGRAGLSPSSVVAPDLSEPLPVCPGIAAGRQELLLLHEALVLNAALR